jgi:hypothetical protein
MKTSEVARSATNYEAPPAARASEDRAVLDMPRILRPKTNHCVRVGFQRGAFFAELAGVLLLEAPAREVAPHHRVGVVGEIVARSRSAAAVKSPMVK